MLRKVSRLDITNISPIKFQADMSVYYSYYKDKFEFKLKNYEDVSDKKIFKHVFDIQYKKLRYITKKDFLNIVNEKIDFYNQNR